MASETLTEYIDAIRHAASLDELLHILMQTMADAGATDATGVIDAERLPATNDERPVHTGVATVDDLFARAEDNKGAFQNTVSDLAAALGGKAIFRPGDGLKSRERVEEILQRNYDADPARVTDALAATITFATKDDIILALPDMLKQIESKGGTALSIQDRFADPFLGYKEVSISVRMPDGTLCHNTKSLCLCAL